MNVGEPYTHEGCIGYLDVDDASQYVKGKLLYPYINHLMEYNTCHLICHMIYIYKLYL